MAIKVGTIEQEEARCRRAFRSVNVGALVHCCHHAIHFEHLTEPWENRVNYILREKPQHERAVRLRWFRPVAKNQIAKMSPERQKADAEWQKADAERQKADAERQKSDAEWQKAYAERQKAVAEWQKADAERQKADAERQKADAEWQKSDAEWQKAYAEWQKAYAEWQKADAGELCPKGCPWNGKDIFGS
jgi:Skp family chaperone for outer membrane proteins